MQASERAGESHPLFSFRRSLLLSSSLGPFCRRDVRQPAAGRQFVSVHQSHLCSNVVAVSSDSVVSWNIFLASGEKVSESEQMLKDFFCS